MSDVYDQLVGILEREDEPRVLVRRMLEALREPTPEVVATGIDAALWCAAFDILLVAVDAADAAEVDRKRQAWDLMRCQLEELGCRVRQLGSDTSRWKIEHLSLEVEVDLVSGDIDGLDYGPNVRFEDLVGDVRRMLQFEQQRIAEKIRRSRLRETHSWDVKLKRWVPRSGEGPILKGGANV